MAAIAIVSSQMNRFYDKNNAIANNSICNGNGAITKNSVANRGFPCSEEKERRYKYKSVLGIKNRAIKLCAWGLTN